MRGLFTNTTAAAEPMTAEKMLAALTQFNQQPRLVGTLMGFPVYVSGRVPDQVVEIHSKDQIVCFRLDDPRIKGTKLHSEISGDKRS